ncbi:MAG TPA: hypothetical protein VFO80_07500 [Sphingomonas sp.]|nr:hypothetical protein [Sphingomonas sp.]
MGRGVLHDVLSSARHFAGSLIAAAGRTASLARHMPDTGNTPSHHGFDDLPCRGPDIGPVEPDTGFDGDICIENPINWKQVFISDTMRTRKTVLI